MRLLIVDTLHIRAIAPKHRHLIHGIPLFQIYLKGIVRTVQAAHVRMDIDQHGIQLSGIRLDVQTVRIDDERLIDRRKVRCLFHRCQVRHRRQIPVFMRHPRFKILIAAGQLRIVIRIMIHKGRMPRIEDHPLVEQPLPLRLVLMVIPAG